MSLNKDNPENNVTEEEQPSKPTKPLKYITRNHVIIEERKAY